MREPVGVLATGCLRFAVSFSMRSTEEEFERQLNIFHSECDAAVRYFYAGYGLQVSIFKNPAATAVLNKAPSFWNATLDALRGSTLITLGRVFDPDTNNHSLTRLISFSQSNLSIFSEKAFRGRMQQTACSVNDIYEPSHDDFRRLKKLIASRRREYETVIRPIRHKLYAHRSVLDATELEGAQPDLDVAKLQKLISFLPRVHGLLWRLYYDGQRPILRPTTYSVERILERPSSERELWSLQEKLVHEASQVISAINQAA